MSNYPLKIIHFFNFVNTFYDLFRHTNSPDFNMKILWLIFLGKTATAKGYVKVNIDLFIPTKLKISFRNVSMTKFS